MRVVLHALALGVASLAATVVALAQPTPPVARVTEDLRLDGAERDFSRVGFVLVRPDGVIVMAELQDFRLRFFDPTGRQLATFGRRGSGPGEFAPRNGTPPLPSITGGTIGDTVWVYDGTLRRFTLVSPDATLIRTLPQHANLPGIGGGGPERRETTERTLLSFSPNALFGDGRMLGQASFGTITSVRDGDRSVLLGQSSERGYAVVDPQGRIAGVVTDQPENDAGVEVSREGGLSTRWSLVPFRASPMEHVAQDGDRVLIATYTITSNTGGNINVRVVRTTGDTVAFRSFPFTGRQISRARADSALNDRMAGYRGGPNRPPSVPPDVADEMERKLRAAMPPVEAPIRSAHLGLDYTIWLGLPTASGQPRRYLVLDERGNPWRTVELPASVRTVVRANRTTVWTMEYDEDGLASIVRYRVQ